ncbi:uncharacterized protein [Parasteatoda tepidariorum]|uniref:uncharacterized protein isoform X1 n=1 Tax=Parasteatoda tepidariorum TaxID=114398 RepID=UPI001C7184A3|nr:uncharacterized protein LOC107445404 [Parasteatoda tepidariorum]
MFTRVLLSSLFLLIPFIVYHAEGTKQSNPSPYHYGYDVKDGQSSHYKKEERDQDGTVRGSYGYLGPDGIFREVHYIADQNGFRAEIKTNEPGTANDSPANVLLLSEYDTVHDYSHDKEHKHEQEEKKTNEEEKESYEDDEQDQVVESRTPKGRANKKSNKKNYSYFKFGERHGGHV